MKTTLAEFLAHPGGDYGYESLGDYALVLQTLLRTAAAYRDRAGSSFTGPSEWLTGYGGTISRTPPSWHSGRDGCTTYGSHLRQIYHDVTVAVAMANKPGYNYASQRWAQEQRITWDLIIRRPSHPNRRTAEQQAWERFRSLHGKRLCPHSLNGHHRHVNVITGNRLIIAPGAIFITFDVTDRQEFKQRCGSSWSWNSLTDKPNPVWKTNKETFAEYLDRAIAYFQTEAASYHPKRYR